VIPDPRVPERHHLVATVSFPLELSGSCWVHSESTIYPFFPTRIASESGSARLIPPKFPKRRSLIPPGAPPSSLQGVGSHAAPAVCVGLRGSAPRRPGGAAPGARLFLLPPRGRGSGRRWRGHPGAARVGRPPSRALDSGGGGCEANPPGAHWPQTEGTPLNIRVMIYSSVMVSQSSESATCCVMLISMRRPMNKRDLLAVAPVSRPPRDAADRVGALVPRGAHGSPRHQQRGAAMGGVRGRPPDATVVPLI